MFKFKEIEKITNGKIINGDNNKLIDIYSLSNSYFEKDVFYVPIIFKGHDNEKNILKSVHDECMGFMINKNSDNYKTIIDKSLKINKNLCILAVDDVNKAIISLGLESRKLNINKEVVAITGSYGKSTLNSLVARILNIEKKVLFDEKNNNKNTRWHLSQLLQYFENYDMAVLELGISQIGVMKYLSNLVKPSIAVITSIGSAHLHNFETKEIVLREKMHIIDNLKDRKILFINNDDEYLKKIEDSDSYKIIRYSINEASNVKETNNGISFTTKIYGKDTNFNLNLYGKHHIRNIIVAIKIAEIYNIKYENIVKVINNFKAVHGRFKVLNNKEKNITVIDDTYNSCYESVKYGLETANNIQSKRKIAVLGTICSGYSKEDTSKYHEEIGEYFSTLNYDYLYLYGDYTKCIYKGAINKFLEKNIKRYKSKEELIKNLKSNIEDGDLIFIKDGGMNEFEDIVYELVNKYSLKDKQN